MNRILDESPRWLICRGQYRQAFKILKRMAAQNGVHIEDEELLPLCKDAALHIPFHPPHNKDVMHHDLIGIKHALSAKFGPVGKLSGSESALNRGRGTIERFGEASNAPSATRATCATSASRATPPARPRHFPSDSNLVKVREILRREHENALKENGSWIAAMADADEDGRDPAEWLRTPEIVASLTREQLRDAARMVLNPKQVARFTLLPETPAVAAPALVPPKP